VKKQLNEKQRGQECNCMRLMLRYRTEQAVQLLLFRAPSFRELMRNVAFSVRSGEGREIKLRMRRKEERK
jgi:hypothetical protein